MTERSSSEYHQLKTWRIWAGPRCASMQRAWRTLWSVNVAGQEATMKVCGVVVAIPQEHNWAPRLSNGLRVNVGTTSSTPSPLNIQLSGGKTSRRSISMTWGGGLVLVGGRESRPRAKGSSAFAASVQQEEVAGEHRCTLAVA